MDVVNVIVSHPETGIVSIDSFGVFDKENELNTVELGEHCYHEKCVKLKYGDEFEVNEETDKFTNDVLDSLDDGYFEVSESTVSFVWATIKNK